MRKIAFLLKSTISTLYKNGVARGKIIVVSYENNVVS